MVTISFEPLGEWGTIRKVEVPRAAACLASPVLSEHFSDNETTTYKLPACHPITAHRMGDWITSETLTLHTFHERVCNVQGFTCLEAAAKEATDLIWLWYYTKDLKMPGLQDTIVRSLAKLHGAGYWDHLKSVDLVYTITYPRSPLRDFLVAISAHNYNNSVLAGDPAEVARYLPQFLADVLQCYDTRAVGNGSIDPCGCTQYRIEDFMQISPEDPDRYPPRFYVSHV
jgi:hypothetical protein